MTNFPVWFAGKADLTGGTVVALVNNDVELIAHEAEVAPGHWQLFPDTAAGQAAANAFVGSKNPKAAATTPGNPVTGAISSFVPGAGGLIAEVTTGLKDLGDASTWASLGWLVLGAILLIIGIFLWIGKVEGPKIESALGTVAGAAVKAP
jgi:hypothetical protein